jgi:hydrogenase-4 component E
MQPGSPLAAEVAHLFGAVALALAFALLTRPRAAALLSVVRAQSAVVAGAAAWQAVAAGSPALAAIALGVLLVGAGALPFVLGRHADDTAGPAPRPAAVIGGAALLVVLALAVAPAVRLAGLPALREDLALGLSAALLALLVLATRRTPLPHLVGLHALANAVALVAVTTGASWATAAATLALFGVVAAGTVALPADAP